MKMSKRNRAITREQYHYFHGVYSMMADQIQETKRMLRKEDDIVKNKRSLATVHKLNLPELHDSLDGGPWVEQVNHMIKALEEQEHQDPLIK